MVVFSLLEARCVWPRLRQPQGSGDLRETRSVRMSQNGKRYDGGEDPRPKREGRLGGAVGQWGENALQALALW